jgi:hypothetical protein
MKFFGEELFEKSSSPNPSSKTFGPGKEKEPVQVYR